MPGIVGAITAAAFANGATHVSLHLARLDRTAGVMTDHPADSCSPPSARSSTPSGATLVPADQHRGRATSRWCGTAASSPPCACRRCTARSTGSSTPSRPSSATGCPQLGREDKQRAVRLLDERGAFTLRRAVEQVADAMGVSRITVYNYLNAIHRP